MDVGVLAVRYAKALYEFALDNGVDSQLYEKSKDLIEIFIENPSLSESIEDPLLSMENKLQILYKVFAIEDDSSLSKVLKSYLKLLLLNKRGNYLLSSLSYFQQVYRKRNNIGIAKITTAVEIDKQMEEKILESASKLLDKKIELKQIIDPKIVGGFILDVDDYRVDASVVAQLNKIKRKLLDKNRRIV